MRITITIEDAPDGSVRVVSSPKAGDLVGLTKGNQSPIAVTSAAAYALGMLTHAAGQSRSMGRPSLIQLPPGIRAE